MTKQSTLSTLTPVIVIDDDEFFRVAIETVLRKRFGVETVIACATVQDAIDQISKGTSFGLGLVDLNMPGIDNRELLDTLKAAQPEIRLVVLSASRSQEDILMALSAGAQGFINKGLGISEAEVAIRQIAGGAVYVPPFTPQSGVAAVAREAGDERSAVTLTALTPRQLEVLRLLVAGQPNKGIARALGINPSTVKFHLSFIFQILGASNRVEAAILGAQILKNYGE
ncbi:DNA-binding response regulator, NarL/FixJ family, contains REC and HTH domains [Salinihabitans flavidus]|uniref:DNA-binding response regulator, NarL/FixJ family, contains REC and HTH domains n=1 Tax=Salinihabitans flavidus TaxID=569882 RepID=A0A1H8VTP9_9RHOB|nr:response regulator transcription factor [Salinihabitans flavidus]SEP18802.1 DNA-binding response regulator, NarL/FixJ family, contains REC and HTH domains [Salinihabitans flavidus]